MPKNIHTIAQLCSFHRLAKVMFKIHQVRLQQYVNWELPDVQAGFGKGRGTGDQIANFRWIMEKARGFQKNIFCFIDYTKVFDCVDHSKLKNSSRDGITRPPYLLPKKPVCRSRSNRYNCTWNNGLGSKLGKMYVKAVHCHPAYLTYTQSVAVLCLVAQLCLTLQKFLAKQI